MSRKEFIGFRCGKELKDDLMYIANVDLKEGQKFSFGDWLNVKLSALVNDWKENDKI